jgi:tetratricopeptide (TPR) repeat protein
MERVNFYFNNGQLERWEVTKPIVDKPLDIAYNSFQKAIELDTKGKSTKNIQEDLIKLKGLYISEGSNQYTLKDYKGAFESFKRVIEIGKLPILNHKDTAIYYYAGLSAQLAGLLEESIPYYEQSIELGFTNEGAVYFNMFDAYKNLSKADEGLKYLEEGFLKYPKNTNILFTLISYYIDKQEDPAKILVYIDKAIETEPNNSSLHFAKGTLYDRLGDWENAVTSYKKAIEIDPNFFDAYYNIGALYFNKGVKYIEEASKVPARELEKYDALMEKANAEFKNSLPYMEQAYKVNPNSKETIEALKNIYFRFRTESQELNDKYIEFNEKSKQM